MNNGTGVLEKHKIQLEEIAKKEAKKQRKK